MSDFQQGQAIVPPAPGATPAWADMTQAQGAPPGYQTTTIPPWVQPPGRKKSTAVTLGIVLAVVLGLLACGGALLASGPGPEASRGVDPPAANTGSGPAASPVAEEQDGKVGDKITIEELQYQVHAVKCGIPYVGLKDFGRAPQGSFCRIDLSVSNTGDKPMYWEADYNTKAEDTKGRKFSADSSAGIFGNKAEAAWGGEINPGNTVRAFVFFDLPKGAKLKEIEVSSGLLGGKAEIKV